MKYKIFIRPDAEKDIEDAAAWYEVQRENLGQEFLDELLNTYEIISDNPHIYTTVYRYTRRALIHRFPFAIYYRVDEDSLVIIAVMHASRNPKQWHKRV